MAKAAALDPRFRGGDNRLNDVGVPGVHDAASPRAGIE